MSKPTLQIIVGSTRPGRVGIAIARWFYDVAAARDDFDVELVDLLEVNLPLLDEPHHPRLREYVHDHTKEVAHRRSRRRVRVRYTRVQPLN
jgi:NAD(P)H-dependent FMN reductase